MRLWRLGKARHTHDTLEGEAYGAKLTGGRWNSKGVALAYTSYHVGTTALEILVHMDWYSAPNFVRIAIDVPDDATMEVVTTGDLPNGWESYPAPQVLADIGDDWVRRGASLLLEVPSAASPFEQNVLINPAHPDAARCTVGVVGDYVFDPRLAKP